MNIFYEIEKVEIGVKHDVRHATKKKSTLIIQTVLVFQWNVFRLCFKICDDQSKILTIEQVKILKRFDSRLKGRRCLTYDINYWFAWMNCHLDDPLNNLKPRRRLRGWLLWKCHRFNIELDFYWRFSFLRQPVSARLIILSGGKSYGCSAWQNQDALMN